MDDSVSIMSIQYKIEYVEVVNKEEKRFIGSKRKPLERSNSR